jgi:hypothetical protein
VCSSRAFNSAEPRPHIVATKNVTVPLGATAALHCRTQSHTQASTSWERHRIPVQNSDHMRMHENGTLQVFQVTKADEGAYVCRVVTRGGSDEATIYVTVMRKPACPISHSFHLSELPTAHVDPSTLHFVEGSMFNISCYVTGDPRPKVEWRHKDKVIEPDGRYYVTYKCECPTCTTSQQKLI